MHAEATMLRRSSARRRARLVALWLVAACVVTAVLAADSTRAEGACLGEPSTFDGLVGSDVVIEGVALEGPKDEQGRLFDPVIFEVERYLKGSGGLLVPIETGYKDNGDSVTESGEGVVVRAGERWRIHASYGLAALVRDQGALGTTGCSPNVRLPEPAPARRAVRRVAGADRIETAVLVSRLQFVDEAPVVYLARADEPADAVVGRTLDGGPLLLVPSCGDLPQVVAEELDRLKAQEVVVLGGPGAICDALVEQAR